MDGATTVMARPRNADSLWVRWPNGAQQTVPIRMAQRDVRLQQASRR